MQINYKWALALMLPLAVSCQDDTDFGGERLEEGDEVVFTVSPQSRTMYDNDDWDATDNNDIYWGNYISSEMDKVKIFCKQASNPIATYQVNLMKSEGQGTNVAESLTKQDPSGVQWGAEGTAHNFYAFYPAEYAGNAFVDNDGQTINAYVANGQSPKAYRAVSGSVVWDSGSSLINVENNNALDPAKVTTVFAQPDMSSAIMVAKTAVDAANYGKPVPLHFNVLADVLDITINGPVVPNTLGGNAENASRDFIKIISVEVRAKDKSKMIQGNFDLNMETGKSSNITNGSNTVLLQLGQNDSNNIPHLPTLFARSETPGTNNANLDRLRLRAFLIPGAVKNLDELEIFVSTDCGDYTQPLSSADVQHGDAGGMATGKIHPIKLKYFKQRGQDFDFTQWMSQLNENIYITELSLPGTWHSTDASYQGNGNTDLVKQFQAGIRAFETHAVVGNNVTVNIDWAGATSSVTPGAVTRSNGTTQTVSQSGNSRKISRTVTWTRTYTSTETATKPVGELDIAFEVKNTSGADLLAGLKDLGQKVDAGEFAFVEIGMENDGSITVPDIGAIATRNGSYSKVITKTQTGTATGIFGWTENWDKIDDPTEDEWKDASVKPEGTSWKADYSYTRTRPVNKFAAGISWLLAKLKADGSNIYTKDVTAETTIGEVRGRYIIKVNTNDDNNESGWYKNVPALFSRWQGNDADKVGSVPLKWGGPIAPGAQSTMTWIYSEQDRVVNAELRKNAFTDYTSTSLKAYLAGNHSEWFEFSAGGYMASNVNDYSVTAEKCQNLAVALNGWLYGQISSSQRTACPMGLVFFNYALGDNATYYGTSLIRTIIYNNQAFPLRRKPTTPANVTDRTNSSFTNNPMYSA